MSEIWKAYEAQIKDTVQSLAWLLRNYQNSEQFKLKALSTRKMQDAQIHRIIQYKTKNGKRFGSVLIKSITPGVMRKYLDARKRDGSPTAGNRESALISTAWNWSLERDMIKEPNPCAVVKRNPEKARTRYVTDQEYQIAYKLAQRYPYLQPMMEMAYLCRMRRTEIINATRAQILNEGFDTLRTKGSKDALTLWSNRLKAAANYKAGNVNSIYIIHDNKGQRITDSAAKSAWTRLKKMMKQAGIEPFNFHDLKSKGVSDFEGDKLKASGHKDPKMLNVYDRKKMKIEATK
jgi:integrase